MGRAGIILVCAGILVAGCAGPQRPYSPSLAVQNELIGKSFWYDGLLDADLCPATGMTFRAPGCSTITMGQQYTIDEETISEFKPFYRVRLADGRSGYVSATTITLSDNETKHAEKLAAEAKQRSRRAAAKAQCDRRGGVSVGMTAAQVRASCWGSPRTINRTTTAGGTREQWVYDLKNYVYFENGVVSAIQH